MAPQPDARTEILARVRAAVGGAPAPEQHPRDYRTAHVDTGLTELLADNLADYRARVHRVEHEDEVAPLTAALLGDESVVIPADLPDNWLPGAVPAFRDTPPLSSDRLDVIGAVMTGCALAIAETGTIVLDGGAAQGRRMITLVPDHHICVVRCATQVVASVPQAISLLSPTRPQTWIAGPSATSDIELDRVEGVHGPRRLDVILLGG
jgi:L-lactate dehydrogenase complex protein LldG